MNVPKTSSHVPLPKPIGQVMVLPETNAIVSVRAVGEGPIDQCPPSMKRLPPKPIGRAAGYSISFVVVPVRAVGEATP